MKETVGKIQKDKINIFSGDSIIFLIFLGIRNTTTICKGVEAKKIKRSKQIEYVDFDVVKDSDFYIFLKLINILIG